MAWEKRGKRAYYYRTEGPANARRKVYLGSGEQGLAAARADRARRESCKRERVLYSRLISSFDVLRRGTDLMLQAETCLANLKPQNQGWSRS